MLYTMKLFEKPYRALENGSKSIELRLYDEKRRSICEGDIIVFYLYGNENFHIQTKVKRIYRFKSFAELYEELPLDKCGYSENEIELADASDMNKYYSPEEQNKYGVVAFEVEIIPDSV